MKRIVRGTSWDDRGSELKEDLMRGMEERCAERCEDLGFRLTSDRTLRENCNPCGASPGPWMKQEKTVLQFEASTQPEASTEGSDWWQTPAEFSPPTTARRSD